MKRVILGAALVCAVRGLAQTPSQAQPPAEPQVKDCDDAHIRYEPLNAEYASRIVAEPTKEPRPTGDPKASPQKSRWMQVVAPDYSKRGPWTTTLWVGEEANVPTLKLTIHNHEGFEVEWLNEKLIYGTVTWSKVLTTDFIFDVESQKFVYREMENTSELAEPCE